MNFSSYQTVEFLELTAPPQPPAPDSQWAGPAAGAAAAAALERLSHSVAVFDAHGSLVYSNLAAHSAIARAGWHLQEGHLGLALACDRQIWKRALRSTCLQGRHGLLELQYQDGPNRMFVSLTPVRWGQRNLALASFEREELCGTLVLQQFSARHGLTAKESQVLRKLCQGLRPAEIAVERGVSQTTVLTQVAAIRVKTGCASVQALLNRLSRLPSLRGLLGLPSQVDDESNRGELEPQACGDCAG